MGMFKEYYGNGVLKETGLIENGLREGRWIFHYENGNKYREIDFLAGIESGEWKMWHENGQRYLEQFKVGGKSEGYWREYYESGKVKEIGEYKNGEYYPKDFWDENGNQLLIDGTGKKIEKFGYLELDVYEHFFENGKLVKEVKISSANYDPFIPDENR